VVVGNTGLPDGERHAQRGVPRVADVRERDSPSFPSAGSSSGGCVESDLSPEVIAAYDAPFPDDTYKAGARIFPSLVPTSSDDPAEADNVAAWEVLKRFDRPFLCAFSDATRHEGRRAAFLGTVPGTPKASRTRPSRAPATSSRRTRGPSSPG
jgi:haloalkane dehalogenase